MPKTKDLLEVQWRGSLSEYVTAIAWSSDGKFLAACSASGEVVLYAAASWGAIRLQESNGLSVDVLAFSSDSKFLATGGQDGTVRIWQLDSDSPQLVSELNRDRVWIDRLQWNPHFPELAFSMGRYAQVWDAHTQEIVTTLNFEDSSVLDLAWHPQGDYLSVGGHRSIKTWNRQDWDNDPQYWETSAASIAIAWSFDGNYLAAGNSDRTLLVWEWGNPYPWQMQGFPGKVRQLAWSMATTKTGAPLLASISTTGIVIWEKSADEALGWQETVLDWHRDKVSAIAFLPGSFQLGSASEDGCIGIWDKAKQVNQVLEGVSGGFSCLQWHPQGHQLAAGGNNGELLVWCKTLRGKGFGSTIDN